MRLNKRKLGLLAIVALAVCGSAWWSVNRARTGSANFETVRRGDLTLEVPIIGALGAARSVDITAPISNDPHFFKIARMTPEGERVEAGQMVMELDTQEINQKLREYQAELGKNEEELTKRRLEYDVQVRDLHVALEEAKVKLETTRHKLEADPEIQSARERKQFQIEFEQADQQSKLLTQKLKSIELMSKAELSVFENNIAKIRLRVQQTEERQKACAVKAPIAGTLIYKILSGNVKRKVGEQTCHHEVILQIPDLTTLRLEAMVEEAYAGRVQPGQIVRIKVDALPDEKLTGKVVSVSSVLRMRRWDNPVKVVDAVIELEQKIGKLSPGMTATGQVEIESVTNVLLAPIKAVREKGGQVIVNVPGSDGRGQERAIRVGRKNQQFVEVLEGLREGEKVMM
ncbi:MAG: efflux RND transporter periplasmic adaptor subunit [Acidobacteria bacterium]|nr:efflux RND transporter periplasmic adaptor subunit [Acidobacteriota bacterium]